MVRDQIPLSYLVNQHLTSVLTTYQISLARGVCRWAACLEAARNRDAAPRDRLRCDSSWRWNQSCRQHEVTGKRIKSMESLTFRPRRWGLNRSCVWSHRPVSSLISILDDINSTFNHFQQLARHKISLALKSHNNLFILECTVYKVAITAVVTHPQFINNKTAVKHVKNDTYELCGWSKVHFKTTAHYIQLT